MVLPTAWAAPLEQCSCQPPCLSGCARRVEVRVWGFSVGRLLGHPEEQIEPVLCIVYKWFVNGDSLQKHISVAASSSRWDLWLHLSDLKAHPHALANEKMYERFVGFFFFFLSSFPKYVKSESALFFLNDHSFVSRLYLLAQFIILYFKKLKCILHIST